MIHIVGERYMELRTIFKDLLLVISQPTNKIKYK
jgi:hypothetical protein